jgi:hypothetical protein
MEIIILIALISGLLSLIFITKEERKIKDQFIQKVNRRHYNKNIDYLENVKEATKKRFEEEGVQQSYKNNIKKGYLE